MALPVLGLGSGVGKALLRSKPYVVEDPPLRSGREGGFWGGSGGYGELEEVVVGGGVSEGVEAVGRSPPVFGKGLRGLHLGLLLRLVWVVMLFLVPQVVLGYPVVRLYDVSRVERIIDWSDTSSVLEYPLVMDSVDFLALWVDVSTGETLSVDTIRQYTGVGEGEVVIPDGFGFRVVGGVLELLIPGNAPKGVRIGVYDVGGRRVRGLDMSVNPRSMVIGFEGMPGGVYFVSADVDGFKARAKVTVVEGRVVGLSEDKEGGVESVVGEVVTSDELSAGVMYRPAEDSVWLIVRELYDTLSPPTAADTGQPWIGDWYDFKAKLPYSVLDLDTVDVLMIPYEELTAADSLGNPYFPGGVLHGMKRLTYTDYPVYNANVLVRWGDNVNVNGRRSSVPLKVVTIVSRPDGTPALDSLPGGYWTTEFWNLISMLNDSVPNHVLPVIVVPFDSSMVYPPLPETLPYPNGPAAPDSVYNVAIYHLGISGQTGSDTPGWTHMYSFDVPIGDGVLPLRCGAWMKIRTDLGPNTPAVRSIMSRELGRGIGLYATGPPPYIMHRNGTVYNGTSLTFHHDEWRIIGLTYGMPLFSLMDWYLTND